MIERKYKIEDGRLVRRADGVPVPEDEPLFIFRAKDTNSLSVLISYQMICKDLNHRAHIKKSIEAFQKFAKDHPERMRDPD